MKEIHYNELFVFYDEKQEPNIVEIKFSDFSKQYELKFKNPKEW